ncbi:hypothetical protein [Halomarina oriensis]|uniref:Uncharacterized protein n=1 Tax=Halomarina oriensis TaxID=671145 RepID=A0A6B0GNZ5_9EURY|nr:hypothetical protein [Halomarina oriensis]MWG36532.1 hypothetical protein [Halomarina oriensis]
MSEHSSQGVYQTGQLTLDVARVTRRPLPGGLEDLSDHRRECYHCHNSAEMRHHLHCTECGAETFSPAVQDAPRCECGGLRECVRWTRRPAGRDESGKWRQTYHHPETGETMTPDELREAGYT